MLALTAEGDVYSWGQGFEGQLGLGDVAVALVPRYVKALHGQPITMVASGAKHSAALSSALNSSVASVTSSTVGCIRWRPRPTRAWRCGASRWRCG